MHCCIGGTRVGADISAFEAGVHVCSGTPGRVFHMIQDRHFSTKKVRSDSMFTSEQTVYVLSYYE